MKISNFIAGTIAGAIVYFLLGWLAYGILFTEIYPPGGDMLFIFLGCVFSAAILAYVFVKWAHIRTAMSGAKAGAVLGLFYSLSMNLYMNASVVPNYQNMATDVVISVISAAIAGAVIGIVLGMMNKVAN
jgi:hypothetical protein